MIQNATVLLGTGSRHARGHVVMVNGKLAAVGEGSAPSLPEGAEVIDAAGKFVTPGLIDTHSHLGVYPWPDAAAHHDGNEMTDPLTPFAQVVDAVWPHDPGFERAARGGVTSLQVLPGSANLIGGRAVTLSLVPAQSARLMHRAGVPDGLKMACGENPKRVYGDEKKRAPGTRMGNLALARAAFFKAKRHQAEWETWRATEQEKLADYDQKLADYEAKSATHAARLRFCEGSDTAECQRWRGEPPTPPKALVPTPPPARDAGLETLIGAMQGTVLVHIHCYRADDMLAMLALADEVGFRIRSFHHALEAYKIRDVLAARDISVSTWSDWWGFKLEAYDGIPENAALVHEARGRAIIHSDSPEGIQRLNQEASKALASGLAAKVALTEDDALRWVTANAAWALGIDAKTGTLEVGKEADVVVWDKSPFSVYAKAERVFVRGKTIVKDGEKTPWSDFELGQPARELSRGGS